MSDDFDFGFTAMNENELETVKKLDFTNQVTTDINKKLEDKIDRLYNAIIPLLTNLKKNPEKTHIYWPNRTAKIEQFEDLLRKIMENEE